MMSSNAAPGAASAGMSLSSSSTTAEDLSDKKVLVRRSSTTDETQASNDSLIAEHRSSSLSLRNSTSGASRALSSPASTTGASGLPPSSNHSSNTQECDYDLNPTVLYQAIEARQWEYAISVFSKHEQGEQSATWVVRKERNGKLRWRLLPLHAAVIFGSPLKLIELLLADYPPASQSKDDQGMLPLHLAFRNEASWEVIEELLTAYPAAVYVSDRKGRTPLQCGMRHSSSSAMSSSASTASGMVTASPTVHSSNATTPSIVRASSTVGGNNEHNLHNGNNKKQFRAVVNVLDVYSQIAVSGERKRAEQEARTLANSSITQLKDGHLKTLSALKAEWEKQQAESKRQMQQLQDDRTSMEARVQELEQQVAEKNESERRTQAKLRRMEVALNQANERLKADNPDMHQLQHTNQMLQAMNEDVIQQQSVYHERVQELLTHFKDVVAEREQLRSILMKNEHQQSKERETLESFERWSIEQGQTLARHRQFLEEEKKIDDHGSDVARRETLNGNHHAAQQPPNQSSDSGKAPLQL